MGLIYSQGKRECDKPSRSQSCPELGEQSDFPAVQKEDSWKYREKQGSTEVLVAEHVILFVMKNNSWMMFMGMALASGVPRVSTIEQCAPMREGTDLSTELARSLEW